MKNDDLAGRLAFLREAERLKDTLRSGFTREGARESSAEHSWRACLFALAFGDQLEGIDMVRLLSLLIVHDLGEIYAGDVPAIYQSDNDGRDMREREDFRTLTESLPVAVRTQMRALFEEYAAGETAEAKLAKGFDKLETLLQHTQGANPDDFDYDFNLAYGLRWTRDDPLLRTIRDAIDAATQRRANGAPGWDDAD